MTDNRHVLQRILEAADLGRAPCALALGLSEQVLDEMLAGQREMPDSMLPLVSAVMGVQEEVLTSTARETRHSDVVPAIWYKLRGDGVTEADREYVLALRQLAFYQHELETVTDTKSGGWKVLFEGVRRETDPQASPAEQGRQAARLLRRSTGLDQGATGIGEVFRGHLRNIGVLVIESPAPDSTLEGCSFYVGPYGAVRPAIFANSYSTTWFRRNCILMHELAHAIFDVESTIATLDLANGNPLDSVLENRAGAFAQEALVPVEVLRHMGQQLGIRWVSIDKINFVKLMAATHVEQQILAKALLDAELIGQETADALGSCDLAKELNNHTSHALSTPQYLKLAGVKESWVKGRSTTTAPKVLRLPLRYVGDVLTAFNSNCISRGKAARMLMIDEHEFRERFESEQHDYDE